MTTSFPQTAQEWRDTLANTWHMSVATGQRHLQAGTFPYDDLAGWLAVHYSAENGYHPDFVPALVRNCRGLVAWVYGDGTEPYWPGRDNDKQ